MMNVRRRDEVHDPVRLDTDRCAGVCGQPDPAGAGHVQLLSARFFFNDTATTEIYTLSLHDALPISNLTRGWNGRGPCQYRNLCDRGCPFGGYFSSNSATLPVAASTGNLTLRPHSIGMEIIYDKEKRKAKGVRIIDELTNEAIEYYARIIFLNASTLGSTAMLLNSRSDDFPNGMGNSSDQLGRNLMDHHYHVGAGGRFDGLKDKVTFGRRPNGIYVARFRNIDDKTKRSDYLRGFGYQGGASRGVSWNSDEIGTDLKEHMTGPGEWSFWLGSWGEQLPHLITGSHLAKLKKINGDCLKLNLIANGKKM